MRISTKKMRLHISIDSPGVHFTYSCVYIFFVSLRLLPLLCVKKKQSSVLAILVQMKFSTKSISWYLSNHSSHDQNVEIWLPIELLIGKVAINCKIMDFNPIFFNPFFFSHYD